jgi:hypothetical protein
VDLLRLYGRGTSPPIVAAALERLASDGPEEPYGFGHLQHSIVDLVEALEPGDGLEERDIARLEWVYLDLMGHTRFRAKHLFRGLATDPDFFMEILRYAYKARDESDDEGQEGSEEVAIEVGEEEEGGEEAETSKEAETAGESLAGRAFRLLFNWRTPPGLADDGSIDEAALREWVQRVRDLAYAKGRGRIADQTIGQVFVYLPEGRDGISPPEVIRDLFEEIGSRSLEQGYSIGVLNSRGITSRSIDAGGQSERALATKFSESAEAVVAWPTTAGLLRSLAEWYEHAAAQEDRRSELHEEGIYD